MSLVSALLFEETLSPYSRSFLPSRRRYRIAREIFLYTRTYGVTLRGSSCRQCCMVGYRMCRVWCFCSLRQIKAGNSNSFPPHNVFVILPSTECCRTLYYWGRRKMSHTSDGSKINVPRRQNLYVTNHFPILCMTSRGAT